MEIAKRTYLEGRPLIEVVLDDTEFSCEELERLLDQFVSTNGGIQE